MVEQLLHKRQPFSSAADSAGTHSSYSKSSSLSRSNATIPGAGSGGGIGSGPSGRLGLSSLSMPMRNRQMAAALEGVKSSLSLRGYKDAQGFQDEEDCGEWSVWERLI